MAFFVPVRLIKSIKNRLNKNAFTANSPIRLNLQFFAEDGPGGERTEKATPRKKQKAREKGQVLQSREISSTVVLLIAFVSLKLLGGYMFHEVEAFFRLCAGDLAINFDVESINELMRLLGLVLVQLIKIIGPIFAIVLVVSIISSFAQVGALFTLEPLKPKFSKLNPVNGIKRIFSF
jgi:flagellar biosynthetic protein FlhB